MSSIMDKRNMFRIIVGKYCTHEQSNLTPYVVCNVENCPIVYIKMDIGGLFREALTSLMS